MEPKPNLMLAWEGEGEKERELPVAVHSMSKLPHQQQVVQMQPQKPQTGG